MTARVLTSPMIIDRVTPTVSTADAHGDSSLPSGGSSNSQEPEMLLCGRRCTTSNTSTTTQDSLQQVTRIRNVARNLFGVPPPTTAQYARDKLREIRKKDAQRWNFDFEKEKPLPGRYKWEAVDDSGPSPPKQRRIAPEDCSALDSLLIVRPVPPSTTTILPKATSPPKLLFPPTPPGLPPSAQFQSPPSAIPPNVLVKASVVDPMDKKSGQRTYLANDSGNRNKSKQMKITMYNPVKKRRIISTTGGAAKKTAF